MKQSFYIGAKALIHNEGKVLLVKDTSKGKWEVPGGRVDKGQSLNEAIKRELLEELGCNDALPGVVFEAAVGDFLVENDHKLCLIFIETVITIPESFILSNEHTETMWASLNDLEKIDIYKTDKAAVSKYLEVRNNV